MSTVTIPARNDGTQNFSETVSLGGVNFNLGFLWNPRESAWYLSIADSSSNPLLTKKITVGTPLRWRYANPALPVGEIVAIDTSGADLDPGLTDLGSRVLLTFTDAADFVAAAAG